MMKHSLLLALLLLAGCDASDDPAPIPEPEAPETFVEIPDATFKRYLIECCDTDQDGEISTTEAEKAATLAIPDGVKELTGIEAFKNIATLCIYKVAIPELKVDGALFPELSQLEIWANTIERLEIGHAPALQKFLYQESSGERGKGSLRQMSISDCPALESIGYRYSYEGYVFEPMLAELQIAGCPRVESLELSHTALHTLPHAGLPNLKKYGVYDTPVESIDLSHNGELNVFECGNNGLTELDLSHCPKLHRLYCREPVQELDLSFCPQLMRIECRLTDLSLLDIGRNPALTYCSVTGNPKLEQIVMTKKQAITLQYFFKDEHTTIAFVD